MGVGEAVGVTGVAVGGRVGVCVGVGSAVIVGVALGAVVCVANGDALAVDVDTDGVAGLHAVKNSIRTATAIFALFILTSIVANVNDTSPNSLLPA